MSEKALVFDGLSDQLLISESQLFVKPILYVCQARLYVGERQLERASSILVQV